MKRATLLKVLLTASLVCPSLSHGTSADIWKEGVNYVSITPSKIASANQHPFQVEADRIARILSNVKVTNKKSDSLLSLMNSDTAETVQVFTKREIHLLARAVSEALNRSTEKEMITFSVSDFRSAYFGNKRLSVSGTMFISEQQLNLLLGEVHVDIQKKYLRSGAAVSNSRFASNAELANFKLSNGNLTQDGNHDWSLSPFPGAELAQNRHDWLKINLNQEYNYLRAEKEKNVEDQYLSESQKQIAPSELEERIRKLENAQLSTQPVQPSPTVEANTVKSRLLNLRSLYEAGAIPESLYLEKMRAIINEL